MPTTEGRPPVPPLFFSGGTPGAFTRAASMLVAGTIALASCAHQPPRFDPGARRTCLVLSAGGTRGVVQLGALQAVKAARIPVACVVGTSVGALIGGLYATAPPSDTTERFRDLAQAYLSETERQAQSRGMQAGALFAMVAATLSGGALLPATAALGGFVFGAASVSTADRARLEHTLRNQLGGARIEALPVPFAALHHQRAGQGLKLVVSRTGDLAAAIGASIANPFVFDDVNVATATAIDAGSDRVAATPVQDACRLFPDANLLAINVTGTPAFYDAEMRCPLREIMVDGGEVSPRGFFKVGSEGGAEFDGAWRLGHDKVAAALRVP